MTNTYTFQDNHEFKQAVCQWMTDPFVCLQRYGPIADWKTGNITDMSHACAYDTFNEPIGTWDTSQVTNMSSMFYNAQIFNQPIGDWDTSQVTNMSCMFHEAHAFNQPIQNWNIHRVTIIINIFLHAHAFDQQNCFKRH